MTKPLIVTAQLAPEDLAWLDSLRKRHYPADRNQVPAHLTMVHSLPPSQEAEVRRLLARFACEPEPQASLTGLMELGRGVAFRVVSADLDRIRDELAQSLHGLLSGQDSGGWLPHVTIQNKVDPKEARALKRSLEQGFSARPLRVTGLGLHRYLGGPWETVALYRFRGAS